MASLREVGRPPRRAAPLQKEKRTHKRKSLASVKGEIEKKVVGMAFIGEQACMEGAAARREVTQSEPLSRKRRLAGQEVGKEQGEQPSRV